MAAAQPTLKDVARQAAVSVTTVSVVLNGKRRGIRVPEATRDRVRRAAEELGYRPNQMARGLRQRTSQAVGFISDEVVTTPYAVSMLAAAQEEAARHGYLLFVINLGPVPTVDAVRRALDSLVAHQVDALVMARMYHQEIEPPPGLSATAVYLNARATSGDFRSIVPDDRGAAREAVRTLLAHGHRRIAYLDDDSGSVASRLRSRGYLDALASYGVEPDPRLHVNVPPMVRGGVRGGELLDLPHEVRPTAVFCYNDRTAMGLYRAARQRGVDIPGELSVIGFDDQEYIASELDPPLTTMRLPHAEMGALAVRAVLGGPIDDVAWEESSSGGSVAWIDCPLVERDSVAPPP